MLPDPISGAAVGAGALQGAGVTEPGTGEALVTALVEPDAPRTTTPTIEPNRDIRLTQDTYNTTLQLIKFPQDMEERGTPYMMLKIYETVTGPEPFENQPRDEFSGSIQYGGQTFGRIIDGIPQGEAIAGGIVGGISAGAAGAVGGALLSTETGVEAINGIGEEFLGTGNGSDPNNPTLTSRAKSLVKSFSLRRNIDRVAYALALFMPDGINTNYDNEYDALSMTATFGAVGLMTQALYARGKGTDMNPFIAEAASRLAGSLLGNEDAARAGLFASTGKVLNPQLEMLYTSPVLRKFVFDFRLIPRDANESAQIQSIVKLLKYHAAPTIPDGVGGRYLIPPAQFEIDFFDGNGQENVFLFKTKKCVLSSINLDYTPNGFATHADGAPVETRMQLTFQEVSIIDRTAVLQGY